MNEKDFADLSDEVINKLNSQLSFNVTDYFIKDTDQVYMRRMLLAYHNELIKRGYIFQPSSK